MVPSGQKQPSTRLVFTSEGLEVGKRGAHTGWEAGMLDPEAQAAPATMHSPQGQPTIPAHLPATYLDSQVGSSAGPQARYSR